MKALGQYSITAATLLLVAVAASWSFVDVAGRASLMVAAAIALPVQVATFALLVRSSVDSAEFMMWWGVGVLGRMLVVVGVGLGLEAFGSLDPTTLVLSLCSFFFVLLLLEPAFFARGNRSTQFAR